MNKGDDLNISEPTEEQIKQTKKLVKEKYGIKVPKKDLTELVKKIKELEWWFKADKLDPIRIIEDYAISLQKLMKENYDKEITMSEAYDQARGLLVLVPFKEKQRLADDMREILVKHKEVNFEPCLLNKLVKIFDLHYGIQLTDDNLKYVLHTISKYVWYEEGLDNSVEKCLDDILIYIDKKKRGKRFNGLNLHNKIRPIFDLLIKELKLKEGEFETIFRDEEETKVWTRDGQWIVGSKADYNKEQLNQGEKL